jgi:hypothetical protein
MDEQEFKRLFDEQMAKTMLPLIARLEKISSQTQQAMKTLNEMGYGDPASEKQMNECDKCMSPDEMKNAQGKIFGYLGDYSPPDAEKQLNSNSDDPDGWFVQAQKDLWGTEYTSAKPIKQTNASDESEEDQLAESQAQIFGY